MPLLPYENKVLIVPIRDPDKSKGGLWIPEEAKERVDQGVVYAIGPTCEIVQAGDHVIFPGYSGQLIQVEDEGTFIMMRETDISLKITGDEVSQTDCPGLYFKGKDGVFFTATVEMALFLIAKGIEDSPWRANFKWGAKSPLGRPAQ